MSSSAVPLNIDNNIHIIYYKLFSCSNVLFRALKIDLEVGDITYEFHFRRAKEIQDSYYKNGALGMLEWITTAVSGGLADS